MINKVIWRIKRLAKQATGNIFPPKPNVICDHERFGSDYGGWNVISKHLESNSLVLCFGVGEDASFDLALIKRFGLKVHAFDPTPRSIAWVKEQQLPVEFILHEYGIADYDGVATFNPPENPEHISHTILGRPETATDAIEVPMKCLNTIVSELGVGAIDLLKIDIEGAEYAVIDDLAQSTHRPKQLLVEFHHRFPDVGLPKTQAAIRKIKSMGYDLFCVSNTAEEFCFVYQS